MRTLEQGATPRRTPAQTHAALRPLLLLLLLSPMLFAMRCSNEDLTGRFYLDVQSDGQEERVTISLPYTGRLALDLGIDAQNDGEIHLRTQVQTSGNPDEAGCDAIVSGRARDVDTAPWDGNAAPVQNGQSYPTIGNLSTRTKLALPQNTDLGAYAGAIELATDHELIRIYSTDNDLSLWDLNGNIVPPIADTHPATCDDIFVTVYEMPRDNVRIAYRSDNPSVEQVVMTDCAEDRVVENVCPGTSGDIREDTIAVEGGTQHVERFSALGVGDILLVEATCDGACPVHIELFGWLEPLECRTKNDCSGGRSCTFEGYCIKEPPPACSAESSTGSTPPLAGLVGLLGLWWVARRTRRASP